MTISDHLERIHDSAMRKLEIRKVLEKDLDIVGIGKGDSNTIIVNISKPPPDGFQAPKTIDGFKIELRVVGQIRKQI